MLTYEQANELFHYEPSSGKLTWKKVTSNRVKIGDEAGTVIRKDGYKIIRLDGKQLFVHRIVAVIIYGSLTDNMTVDHIDHNRTNNSYDNIRIVSKQVNTKNQSIQSNNFTGVAGVYMVGNKYKAQIGSRAGKKYLGTYKTLEEAAMARKSAEFLYGYHPNHGNRKVQ